MNSTMRKCANCGATNRIPAKHLADAGKCGECKATLAPLDSPVDADAGLFDEVMHSARVPVLVDFWAEWCSPCRAAGPEVAALAREMAGKAIVLKVDTESHPELAARYRVQSIPNFVVIKNGQIVLQRAGVSPRAEMRRWLEQAAAA